jgi:hypothetical protein
MTRKRQQLKLSNAEAICTVCTLCIIGAYIMCVKFDSILITKHNKTKEVLLNLIG